MTLPNMAKTSIHLPDELIELILTKSPIKSVLRFKSVSKSWKSIISDPRFLRTHRIQRSKMPENQKKFFTWGWGAMVYGKPTGRHVSLIALEEDGKHQIESELGFDFQTVSFCNGLFLLGSHCQQNKSNIYMLWNPSIRKHTMILAVAPSTRGTLPWQHHLYYDSITDDYKIVLAYDKCYTIYSCKNGTWDIRDFSSEALLLIESASSFPYFLGIVFVDGCFYMDAHYEIGCVDSRDGKLHKIRLPDGVDFVVVIVELSGHLCLDSWTIHSRRLEMWVMEKKNGSFENCWRKLTCTVIEHERPLPIWERALVWWINEDNDAVFRVRMKAYDGPEQLLCNPYEFENSFRKVAACGKSCDKISYHLLNPCYPYLENLYMPSSN